MRIAHVGYAAAADRFPHAQPSTNKELLDQATESILTSSLGGFGRRDRLDARTDGSSYRSRKRQQMAASEPASCRSPTPAIARNQAKRPLRMAGWRVATHPPRGRQRH